MKMKKTYLTIAMLLVLVALSVYGCGSTTTITQQPTTTVTKIVTAPQYTTYTMNLTHDNNPGTTKAYLQSSDVLHLIWYTDDQATVALLVFTPSGKSFGLDSNNNFTENYGTSTNGGAKNVNPSDLGSGDGYYTLMVDAGGATANVTINYWIESK